MRSASRDNFSEKDSLVFRCAFTDIPRLLFTNQNRAPYTNGPAGCSRPLTNPEQSVTNSPLPLPAATPRAPLRRARNENREASPAWPAIEPQQALADPG